MKVHSVSKENFHKEVLSSEKQVLLDFWAPWCGPCQMVLPILEEIAAERPDVKVCKVNVDEEHELAARYKVYRLPTLVVMSDGVMEDKVVGAKPKPEIMALLV